MKYIVYIFLLFPILVTAQTYKYIIEGYSTFRKMIKAICGFSPMKEWIVIMVKI